MVSSLTTDFGGHSDRVTPVPIPNTEVKPVSADGTWGLTPWESRTPPDSVRSERPRPSLWDGRGRSFAFSGLSAGGLQQREDAWPVGRDRHRVLGMRSAGPVGGANRPAVAVNAVVVAATGNQHRLERDDQAGVQAHARAR